MSGDDRAVHNVLLEAADYLCKLGNNLRSRSENLKEKHVNKNKLKNIQSVQKAADKMLLICELSKKSIENVETGIKKVIDVCSKKPDAGNETSKKSHSASEEPVELPTTIKKQSSTGPSSKIKKQSTDENFQYIKSGSTNVKIPLNVSMEQYLSCKVCTKKMSLAKHNEYPIYYNCKLFRKRYRALLTEKELESTVKSDDIVKQSPGTNNNLITNIKEENNQNNESVQEESKKDKVNDQKANKYKHIRLMDDSSTSSNDEVVKIQKQSDDLISEKQPMKNSETINSDDVGSNILKEVENLDQNVDDKISNSDEINEIVDKIDNKDKHQSDLNMPDSESQILLEKEAVDDTMEKNISHSENLDENVKKPLLKCVNINKLLKNDFFNDNSDPKKVKKLELGNINKKHLNDNSDSKTVKKLELGNMNKKHLNDNSDPKNVKKLELGNINKKHEKKIKISNKSEIDEEYWAKKRKEIEAFKPKNFKILVTQLPKFTNTFLINHNISKITQNNAILIQLETKSKDCEKANKNKQDNRSDEEILEIQDETHVKTSNKQSKRNKHSNKSDNTTQDDTVVSHTDKEISAMTEDNVLINITKVKSALLNDSDSEKNETASVSSGSDSDHGSTCKEKNNIVNLISKKGTSDCDTSSEKNNRSGNHQKDEEVQLDETNEPKNLENRQSSDTELNAKNDEGEPEKETFQETNSRTNLNQNEESDSAIEKNPKRKRKQSSGSTPHSKRKHIMESMYAKKLLLTYSSSETEDEELRNALKEIKNDLLAISDEEKEKKQKEVVKGSPRTHSSSSDSETAIIKRKIKKKKMRKSSNDSNIGKNKEENTVDQKSEDNSSKTSSISQIDGNVDDQSNSSIDKMGRSSVKAGSSTEQNSESQETLDKDIDGLTNLKSLNKPRARRNSATSTSDTNDIGEVNNVIKAQHSSKPTISTENMLEADSDNSNDASEPESRASEELPSMSLAELNGADVIVDFAKDDLLEESDASNSQNSDKDNESTEVVETLEESESENKQIKRRKGNAISSDSEGGSARRKDARLSDFEDSGEDSSEVGKKKKRKKKASDSDGSASGSDDNGKKKRRRIKQVRDSDASGSESETEGRKHGRKNIRKVMGKDQLEEATKKAAREEKERIARITERQKLYNNLAFDETGKPDEVVLDKVILDFDPETKEPLIQVDSGLVKKLKPHQANGIKFMWDACFESVKRIKKSKGSGCILAHCMGLGKTLQVVTLAHTLLRHARLTGVRRVLVVCPLSTVLNWVGEFRMWLAHARAAADLDIYELSRYKQNSERAFQLQEWLDNGGVCVLGYEMFRNLSADNSKKFRKKMLKSFQESLVNPGPDMVVCDEGHLLKNEKTSLSQSMNRVRTLRRIVLTGTPLQNNLKEYYCMVQFVKPNLLGKYNEYLNRFVNPITNGQYTDSTEHDIRVMKRRSHVLHKMLDGAVQRRDYGVLAPFLPPKHEYVLFITLTDVQIKLYEHYLDNYSRRPLPGKSSGFLFPDFQSLQRIWTHPLVMKYNSERYEIMQQKKREREEEDSEGSLVDFIDDDSTPEETSTEESSDDMSDVSDDSQKKGKKKKSSSKKAKARDAKSTRRGTRANPGEETIDEDEKRNSDVEEVKNENPTEWWIPLVNEDELEDLRNSHKLVLLFDILRQCEAIGDKLLVFSQSLYSLDLIEHFLGKVDEATQEGRVDEKLGGHVGSWSPGIDYFRLDGSTSCENRSIWCKNFNREDNPRARLFLISTRAGGLGINLVAANRVVIFDVSWNPSHDVQSIFRVYRFGQKKPCYVYRFLVMGTMEEKIYERQVTKQAISKRVIDEQQIDRHYAENDLAELYRFEPRPPAPRELPPLPRDRLFAEMLKEHENQIYKYHEHDSLLENKEEETLTEEERKAAWEDFENEKNKPPPMPFSAFPMHNGMAGMMAQQQQQQLAYAALAGMLRKEYPNLTDQQLANMLPLIYNSNPGMFGGYDYSLMQKMNDIYKYQPSSLMNPGMMNPMNAGAMGGTSGLQYEPPWQRQQQQQQQMRLQQLMQQQNMGAKYYAGGLGSRDPVAMAMQQQRAREMLLGEGPAAAAAARGRPRGRPPLQPRAPAPAPAPADVVDLDSD